MAVLQLSVLEGWFSAFENFYNLSLDLWRFKPTGDVIEGVGRFVTGRADDLLGITHHRQVGVVSDHDDLAVMLGLTCARPVI